MKTKPPAKIGFVGLFALAAFGVVAGVVIAVATIEEIAVMACATFAVVFFFGLLLVPLRGNGRRCYPPFGGGL